MKYKIINCLSLYPNYVLTLSSSDSKIGYWVIDDIHAEEQILDRYKAKNYEGVLLDELPQSGGWIEKKDIRFL